MLYNLTITSEDKFRFDKCEIEKSVGKYAHISKEIYVIVICSNFVVSTKQSMWCYVTAL